MKMTNKRLNVGLIAAAFSLSSAPSIAEDEWDQAWEGFEEEEQEVSPWSHETSIEFATALRTEEDPVISNDATLAELRNNWSLYYETGDLKATFKADLVLDGIESDNTFYNRETNLYYRLSSWADVKIGRQILTWGTGDLIFLNDMFPKDWQSFFSGRDTQYLKAPSDAIKSSFYSEYINIDLIYSPEFDSDIYIDGERLSYYSAASQSYNAAPPTLNPSQPKRFGSDDEISLRTSQTVEGTELALYYYKGFYKSPNGVKLDPITYEQEVYFPQLRTYGASVRTNSRFGLINSEIAYYDSREDREGSNPFVPNSQTRLLFGYETEALTNLTISFQYYLERTENYRALIKHSTFPELSTREYRQVWTNRLTYLNDSQTLTYSLFTFYSTSDKDGYLRPSVKYRYSDQLHLTVGGNLIFGEDKHTFFNRFQNNSNLFIRTKFYF